jgi:hypothetical protein
MAETQANNLGLAIRPCIAPLTLRALSLSTYAYVIL